MRPLAKVTVVGLGPGRPGLVTSEALAAIETTPVRWLRTSRHPSAATVAGARSFDYLYESAATLERGVRAALSTRWSNRPPAEGPSFTRSRGRPWWPSGPSSCCGPTPG